MNPFVVEIVRDPEFTVSESGISVCISMPVGIKTNWSVETHYKVPGGRWSGSGFSIDSVAGLLGHLHTMSRSDTEKYLFMTEEAAAILLPAMVFPVVEFKFAELS